MINISRMTFQVFIFWKHKRICLIKPKKKTLGPGNKERQMGIIKDDV